MINFKDIATGLGYLLVMLLGSASGVYLVYGSTGASSIVQSLLLLPFALIAAIIAMFIFMLVLAGVVDFIIAIYRRVIRQ